jgi:hypothetical protein
MLARLTGSEAHILLGDSETGFPLVAGGARIGAVTLAETAGFEAERWDRLRDAILP